ncbi:MAG: Gfo/Idh/MocA family oxidoreductase [Clostridiales Family XIII bacterium]|nr:Gfo/Idh/MocA family oxidoreductase [Clostridiales Family XIII bacterium]
MRIGVICPSEIALRRFMPALQQIEELEFAGLAVCTAEERFGQNPPAPAIVNATLEEEHRKAQVFIDTYGGKLFEGYGAIAASNEIDALYIPLPPALHFRWAKEALSNGKHVLIEKPSTLAASDTKALTELAASGALALHENYMFAFHDQLNAIQDLIADGEIGDVRLYRISFGFPKRAGNDFRYDKALGGGALFDCGGYTIKYAGMLLGDTARILCAQSNHTDAFEVDVYGSATLVNDRGVTAQIAFGMDNSYKCDLEVWGSLGSLRSGRVLTAPAGFVPTVEITHGDATETRELPSDDAFAKSLKRFVQCIHEPDVREENYGILLRQSEMVDGFLKLAKGA